MYEYHVHLPDDRVITRKSTWYFTHTIIARPDFDGLMAWTAKMDETWPLEYCLRNENLTPMIETYIEEVREPRQSKIQQWFEQGAGDRWFAVSWTGVTDLDAFFNKWAGRKWLQDPKLVEVEREWIGEGADPEDGDRTDDEPWGSGRVEYDRRKATVLIPLILDGTDGMTCAQIQRALEERYRRPHDANSVTRRLMELKNKGRVIASNGVWSLVGTASDHAEPKVVRSEVPVTGDRDPRTLQAILYEMLAECTLSERDIIDKLRGDYGWGATHGTIAPRLSRLKANGSLWNGQGMWFWKGDPPKELAAKTRKVKTELTQAEINAELGIPDPDPRPFEDLVVEMLQGHPKAIRAIRETMLFTYGKRFVDADAILARMVAEGLIQRNGEAWLTTALTSQPVADALPAENIKAVMHDRVAECLRACGPLTEARILEELKSRFDFSTPRITATMKNMADSGRVQRSGDQWSLVSQPAIVIPITTADDLI